MLERKINLVIQDLSDSQLNHCLVEQLNKNSDNYVIFLVDMTRIAYTINFPIWPILWAERNRKCPTVIFDTELAIFLPNNKDLWHYSINGDNLSKLAKPIFRSRHHKELWESVVSGPVVEDFNLTKIQDIINNANH